MVEMILWGVIFVLAVIAECASLQLVSIWFAFGAAAAFTAAFFKIGFVGQFGIFVAVSGVLLIASRPLLKKLKVKRTPAMNSDREIGDTAVVIEEVNPALGTVVVVEAMTALVLADALLENMTARLSSIQEFYR